MRRLRSEAVNDGHDICCLVVLGAAATGPVELRDSPNSGVASSALSSETNLTTLPATWSGTSESGSWSPSAFVVKPAVAAESGGAVYADYDGLDRQVWRNTSNSSNGAYASYTYDESGHGAGIGRLTNERFTNGAGAAVPLSGGYSYTYDGRGQVTQLIQTAENTSYTMGYGYDDAGLPTSLTYPDGETLSESYGTTGWLSLVSTQPSGGSSTTLLSNIGYTSDVGGLAGNINSASVGNGTYSYSASYDADLRLTSLTESLAGGGATQFGSVRTYDGAGNVVGVQTTLPAGSDTQAFCYDEQNQLTWAGAVGTPPCTGTAIAPGTLTSAQYSQSYSYDAFNRLTSGPLGGYTYGNGQHQDGATAVGSGYTASYDAAGDMTCRAPTASSACAGSTPTGQQLSYDGERRLAGWASGSNGTGSQTAMLYDGAGQRVEQVVQQAVCTTDPTPGCTEQTQSQTVYLAGSIGGAGRRYRAALDQYGGSAVTSGGRV